MKRFLLILLFVLLSAAKCDQNQSQPSLYVFQKTYGINQEVQSVHDLFSLLHTYGQDSIPLVKWPAFTGTNDKGYILQQMLTKRTDSINYIFVYNTHKIVDSTFYDIKVRKIILTK